MLSVIIPFYKDYPYLRQAVHSVLAQGMGQFEIIIVNDNPTPEAIRFLDGQDFPKSVSIVHHEVNRGLSAARNTGVARAKGDFIVYLDADDYFIPGGLKEQLRRARLSQADVTHSTTLLRMDQGVGSQQLKLLSRDQQMFEVDIDGTVVEDTPDLQFIISSWKSIYRRDFLERTQIVFDEEQRKFEDRLYVLQTVFSGATFTLVSQPSRIWRRRPGSITTSQKSDVDLEMMAALIDKCTLLLEKKQSVLGIDPVFLKREVFHSTARLIWDTPLLAKAAQDDPAALRIREVLQRSLGRAEIDASLFRDPVIRKIDRVGLTNPAGEQITAEIFLSTWKNVSRGNWAAVQKPLTPEDRAMALDKEAAATTVKPPKMKKGSGGRFADVTLDLHIGQHKTGTTHLQREFHSHREALKARGILFPQTGFIDDMENASKAEATPGHQGILRAIIDNDREVLEALEAEVAASGCKKVLISCENLSFPYQAPHERRRRVRLAHGFFANFPNRRVISVIRRPDEYVESLYRERVGNAIVREWRSPSEYLSSFAANLLDLERMFAPWQDFADDNLLLLDYGTLKTEASYAQAFCTALGYGADDLFPAEKSAGKRTYQSTSWDEVELIRLINMMIPDEPWRRATAHSFVNTCAALGRSKGQPLLSPDERIGAVKQMRDSSKAFLEAHGLRLDFDALVAELEAERETWSPPDTIKLVKFEALINALIGTRHLAPATITEDRGAIGRLLGRLKNQGAVLKIYGLLPSGAQRAVRWAYGRFH